MKEIKFISHLLRNSYLYFTLYVTIFLLKSETISLTTFLFGLITLFVAYAPVYFLNDYTDRYEDIRYKKANLYNVIHNKKIFWSTTLLLILLGITLTYHISQYSLILLLMLYLLNATYSFKPIRAKDKPILRETVFFTIYIFKFLLGVSFLHYPPNQFPISVIIMGCSMATISLLIYKRHIKREKQLEYIFSVIFLISWLTTILISFKLAILFIPLLPGALILNWKYKIKQVPINIYQVIYFLYSLSIFILTRYVLNN